MHYFLDLNLEEIKAIIQQDNFPSYRGFQIWEGIYKQLKNNFNEITNLPASLKTEFTTKFVLKHLFEKKIMVSKDGQTIKILFQTPDGNSIESVLMKYYSRRTACISTQSGCAMGCVYCATGQMGFFRNLSSGEIIEQVLFFERILRQENSTLTNIVLMGMGEPFHNYQAVIDALRRMNDPSGLNIGSRRFTISTVGIIPGIKRLMSENLQVNLAVSLHAATDELRSSLMPINNKYSIPELLEACVEYVSFTKRRISFEWALIDQVNDRVEQAEQLGKILKRFIINNAALCHVNIIPLNPTKENMWKSASRNKAEIFKRILINHGIPCTIRISKGIDIKAGCGQLASSEIIN